MAKLSKKNWLSGSHDQMDDSIAAVLSTAGFKNYHVIFSMYETTSDGSKEDLSDWMVKWPDPTSLFAEGKVQFIMSVEDDDNPILGSVLTNPTWGDVLIEAERSCRMRGAPELDHLFLEDIEPDGPRSKGIQRYEMHWGS